MELTESTLLAYAPGVRPYARDERAVQFGLDATRSGIVELPAADALRVLRTLSAPTPLADIVSGLSKVGELDAQSAREIVNDLVAFRILVPRPAATALVVGRSELTSRIIESLSESGMTVRSPLREQSLGSFLARHAAHAPVFLVDQLAHAEPLARSLRHHGGWIVPCSLIESRVRIGPLAHAGIGPCPMCTQLHDVDRDEAWHTIAAALPAGPESVDSTVAAAGAAMATVIARRIVRIPDPPGVAAPAPAVGDIAHIDPFGSPTITMSQQSRHARCPVCF